MSAEGEGADMKVKEIGFVYSEHYRDDDVRRERTVNGLSDEEDEVIAKFLWDRGHREGAEWHWICSSGVIIVTNAEKSDGKLVCTKLIARPQQLKRYREMGLVNELTDKTRRMKNWLMPQWLIAKAMKHQKEGLNLT
jgi:hypothetical protein